MKIEKTNVVAKTRQLTSTWTYESDIKDAELEISNEALKILQEEIDWEIISEMLVAEGWTQVTVSNTTANYAYRNPKKMEDWINKNIKGKSRGRGVSWFFENAEDAAWFALRWL